MRSDYYSHLTQLVGKLDAHEIKVVQKYIVAFYSNSSKGANKSLKLFKLIVQRPSLTKEDAKRLVSKDSDSASFRRLVVRLSDKICDAILLNHTLQKNDNHSRINKVKFDLRKKLMQAQVFRARGLSDLTVSIYDQIIEKAKKYELYNELVETLSLKQQLLGLMKGGKEFHKYSNDINFFERCRSAFIRSKDWYYRYFLETDYSGLNNDRLGLLTEAVSELQEEYNFTDSANVGFFLYTLMMEYYLAVEEYDTSCETGFVLVDLMEGSKHLFSRKVLGNAYSNLADSQLFVGDFANAEKFAVKAQSNYEYGSFNFQVTKEVEFRAKYYSGNPAEAFTAINELLEITNLDKTPFHYSKRAFLKACVLFVQSRHRESFFLLQETKEIEKDKEGWNIGIRLLSIMNQIEMDFLDFADAQIESMRKHIQRAKANGSIRKRDEIILSLLLKLEKYSFNFQDVYDNNQEQFALLQSPDKDYRWEVKTPEMIVFQDWFMAKINEEPYQFSIPTPVPVPAKPISGANEIPMPTNKPEGEEAAKRRIRKTGS